MIKERGSLFLTGEHAFKITSSGLDVFPRLTTPRAATAYDLVLERQKTGVEVFDTMIADGLWRGASKTAHGGADRQFDDAYPVTGPASARLTTTARFAKAADARGGRERLLRLLLRRGIIRAQGSASRNRTWEVSCRHQKAQLRWCFLISVDPFFPVLGRSASSS
ncbi:MAG: hypothetical protein HGA39_01970 [Coriobacteriia bacterium]|nr:hypothetical protein [Coriobacteriia bacterium]